MKKHKVVDVVLIFPPVWLPESPFLSTPVLTSFLNKNGHFAIQKDLNLEFWQYFYETKEIKKVFITLQIAWEELIKFKNQIPYEENIKIDIASVVNLSIDRFVYEVQNEIIPKSLYRKLVQLFSEFHTDETFFQNLHADIKKEPQNYHDLLFRNISLSPYTYSTKDLLSIVTDKKNRYIPYFSKNVIPSLGKYTPLIYGISISAINQVVPAFSLAHQLKSSFPESHIVIGGSWCTQIHKKLGPKLHLFPYIDSMVIFEGEEPLVQLCQAIKDKTTFKTIPNLFYKENGKVIKSNEECFIDLNSLKEPDFDGLPLNKYDDPLSIPLQSSRGCYWGKCIFCSYPTFENKYKMRDANKIIEDIRILKDKYNVKTIVFTDSVVSPKYAKDLSDSLISSNQTINWIIFARFETEFNFELLKLMAKSGCVQICWGLESGNKRILNTINKNLKIEETKKILRNASELGIKNRVLIMYGHPTETFNEAIETVDYLKDNFQYIDSLSYNYYHPEINTPIENLVEPLKIDLKINPINDLSMMYEYKSFLTDESIATLATMFEDINDKLSLKLCTSEELKIFPNRLLQLGENCYLIDIDGNNKKQVFSIIINEGSYQKRKAFCISHY
jgi:radical SAM superfamily enzyme YgiQ (UPF0313 family)